MKFPKRMKPMIQKFDGIPFEAIEKFKTRRGAQRKAEEYSHIGFSTRVTYEGYPWGRWFVWISNQAAGKRGGVRRDENLRQV